MHNYVLHNFIFTINGERVLKERKFFIEILVKFGHVLKRSSYSMFCRIVESTGEKECLLIQICFLPSTFILLFCYELNYNSVLNVAVSG